MRAILALAAVTVALLGCGNGPRPAAEVPPQGVNIVQPAYPEEARKAGIQGYALVEVTVDAEGAVLACGLAESSGNSLLDQAALDAARSSRFSAGTKDGKPVEMKLKIPFRFKLADSWKEQRGEALREPKWAGRQESCLPQREV
jgi:TonB family protein